MNIFIISFWLLFLLQFDDSLRQDANEILSVAEDSFQGESEAYLYLLGFRALDNEHPTELGKTIFTSIKERESFYALDSKASESLQVLDSTPKNTLQKAIPTHELLCDMSKVYCLNKIFDNIGDIDFALNENKVFFDRYQNFMQLPDYKTLSIPHESEPIINFQSLVVGNQLLLLNAIQQSSNRPRVAADSVINNINNIRHLLARSDTIIMKMVLLSLLSSNIDVLSVFLVQHKKITERMAMQQLSPAERDMKAAFAREFFMMYTLLTGLDKNPEMFEIGGDMPRWQVRAVYKPNITINRLLPIYQHAITLSTLSEPDFIKQNQLKPVPAPSWLRNPVGTILTNVAMVDFNLYTSRLHDINNKINVFNDIHSGVKSPEVSETYDESLRRGERYRNSDNKVCVKSIDPTNKNLPCLQVSL